MQRTLASLMPAITRPAYARQPPATAQVIADWPLIVGPRLAATTLPRRLAAGTLTIACPGPAAMELQHATDLLIGRINQHLGHQVVTRIKIMQQPLGPPPAPPPPPPPPRPETRAAVEQGLAHLPAGPLRDALASLGVAIRQRRA